MCTHLVPTHPLTHSLTSPNTLPYLPPTHSQPFVALSMRHHPQPEALLLRALGQAKSYHRDVYLGEGEGGGGYEVGKHICCVRGGKGLRLECDLLIIFLLWLWSFGGCRLRVLASDECTLVDTYRSTVTCSCTLHSLHSPLIGALTHSLTHSLHSLHVTSNR